MNFDNFYNHLLVQNNQEKGDQFETLVRNIFKKYIQEADTNIRNICIWQEWEYRQTRDLGIDLVCEKMVNNEIQYTAIQCKFLKRDTTLYKSNVNSFLANIHTEFRVDGQNKIFSRGEIYATTNKISDNLLKQLDNLEKDVSIRTYDDISKSGIRWDKDIKKIVRKTKELRLYQKEALNSITSGFKETNRGKLIMACGTGKTLVAINVVSEMQAKRVLYLLPSLSLVQQTLDVFRCDSAYSYESGLVCSDHSIKNKDDDYDEYRYKNEDNILFTPKSLRQLTGLSPTTDPTKIKDFLQSNKDDIKIVFSTYQSLNKIQEAFKQYKDLPKFDIVFCDEAHKTAGVQVRDKISNFKLIQDPNNIPYNKVLFMTATPKIYGETAQKQAQKEEGVEILYTMDDEKVYGKEFFNYSFGKAIEDNYLTDYKVVILKIRKHMYKKTKDKLYFTSEFSFDDDTDIARKNKESLHKILFEFIKRKNIKKTLVFTHRISESKKFTETVETTISNTNKDISARHVSGSDSAYIKKEKLAWLREEGGENKDNESKSYKFLSNAKCLTEGIDVPNIDGVLFLRAKKSKIDIVQAVGRAIRKSDNKRLGYIILPIIIPSGKSEDKILEGSVYKETWNILKALRSHDENLGLDIDKIKFNKKPFKIDVEEHEIDEDGNTETSEHETVKIDHTTIPEQNELFKHEDLYLHILKEVGDRNYLQTWTDHIVSLTKRLLDQIDQELSTNQKFAKVYEEFTEVLRKTVKQNLNNNNIKIMLCQHLITEPIFLILFPEKSILNNIPLFKDIEKVLTYTKRSKEELRYELKEFYEDVENRVKGISNFKDKQEFLNKLYGDFFQKIDKELADEQGVVYTKQDIVSFMIRMSNSIFKQEFGKNIDSSDIRIIDPFVGSGNFIINVLQYFKETLKTNKKQLSHKYQKEIFCNEINLLAYYIATINIQYYYHEITGTYQDFTNISLVDTFKTIEDSLNQNKPAFTGELFKKLENPKRIEEQKEKSINFIITNPPYNRSQRGSYMHIDNNIENLYKEPNPVSKLFNSLYDDYVRAFIYIKERLDKEGIACVITNNQFIDKTTFYSFREQLQIDYDKIYHFDLKGNSRDLSKEDIKKQGGNIFGIMTGVGITILVRNPKYTKDTGRIYLYQIADYTKQQEKLDILNDINTIDDIKNELTILDPKKQPGKDKNIWINLGTKEYEHFYLLSDNNKNNQNKIFNKFSKGLISNRNNWVTDFDKDILENKIKLLITEHNNIVDENNTYDDNLYCMNFENIKPKEKISFDQNKIILYHCKPFVKKYVYLEKNLFARTYKILDIFRTEKEDLAICMTGKGKGDYSNIISDKPIDLQFLGNADVYPLYFYTRDNIHSNITQTSIDYFTNIYGKKVKDKDIFYYIYAITNSLEYKETYKNNLFRDDPRIPILKKYDDFVACIKIGKDLSNLHLNYETLKATKDVVISEVKNKSQNHYNLEFKPGFTKIKYKKEQKKIIYNDNIIINNIPIDKLNKYLVSGKNIVEHLVGLYKVKNFKSGMSKNPYLYQEKLYDDPNNFDSDKKGKYIYDLILKGITLGIETEKLIQQIPKIENNFVNITHNT